MGSYNYRVISKYTMLPPDTIYMIIYKVFDYYQVKFPAALWPPVRWASPYTK